MKSFLVLRIEREQSSFNYECVVLFFNSLLIYNVFHNGTNLLLDIVETAG